MAVAHVNTYQDQGGGTESSTIVATGSNKLLIPAIAATNTSLSTMTAITIGGVSAAGITSAGVDAAGTSCMFGFGHVLDTNVPAAGSQTIEGTWSGGVSGRVYHAIELSGVDQTTPIGTPVTNSAETVSDGGSVSVTLSNHNGQFALVYIASGSGTNTVGGGHGLPAAAVDLGDFDYGATRVRLGYIAAVASNAEVLTFTASFDGTNDVDSVLVGAIPVYGVGETSVPDGPEITSVDTDNVINPSQTDVSVAISNAAASVTSLDQINLGGTVSGETITGGTDMLNLRWNSGTPLFDVPSGMTIANGYDIHVKYTP